ncbi:UNVERIFIED_CONTAM: hypothetical protein GTU68_022949, partial [Idotea baltica]|nr:hypothetical protein [Idotea baltica]
FELDGDAIDNFQENICDTDLEIVDIIQADVLTLKDSWNGKFDTVLLNPPFGTKRNQGMDVNFLRAALDLSSNCVLSLHKTSTRNFILNKAKEWDVDCKVIAALKYNIPNTYKFHKKVSVDIEVDFIRFMNKKR